MIEDYFITGGLLSGFALLVAWMFITSHVPVAVRIFSSAAAVIFAIGIWLNATTLMGYAVAAKPRGPAPVLCVFDDRDHGFIYVWIEEKSGPRAYQIVYRSSLAEKLLQGRRQVEEEGGQMVLRDAMRGRGDGRPAKPKGNDTGSAGDGLEGQDSLGLYIDIIPVLPAKG